MIAGIIVGVLLIAAAVAGAICSAEWHNRKWIKELRRMENARRQQREEHGQR